MFYENQQILDSTCQVLSTKGSRDGLHRVPAMQNGPLHLPSRMNADTSIFSNQ